MDTGAGEMEVGVPVRNWFWPIVGTKEAFDPDNPAVQGLNSVLLYWPHPVDLLENRLEGKNATVLVRSHAAESWRWKQLNRIDMQVMRTGDGPSRGDLMSSPLAVAIDGTFGSYFAERPVPPSLTSKKPEDGKEGESGDEKPEGEKPESPEAPPEKKPEGPDVVKRSETPTQLVVVGNAVFISDPVLKGWPGERAEVTLSLALNLVTWLSGSPELISLRTKRYASRSLVQDLEDEVEALGKQAEAGDIDEASYRSRIDALVEARKDREKRSRWWNLVLPLLIIWGSAGLVLVVRAANRSAKPNIPAAVPPASLGGGGTDS
jgi:hypothetical protein